MNLTHPSEVSVLTDARIEWLRTPFGVVAAVCASCFDVVSSSVLSVDMRTYGFTEQEVVSSQAERWQRQLITIRTTVPSSLCHCSAGSLREGGDTCSWRKMTGKETAPRFLWVTTTALKQKEPQEAFDSWPWLCPVITGRRAGLIVTVCFSLPSQKKKRKLKWWVLTSSILCY